MKNTRKIMEKLYQKVLKYKKNTLCPMDDFLEMLLKKSYKQTAFYTC